VGYSRKRPKHLGRKLLQIRRALGLSQGEMVKRLGADILPNSISKYENDHNEPPTDVLLIYAQLARVPLEQLVDDELELTQM